MLPQRALTWLAFTTVLVSFTAGCSVLDVNTNSGEKTQDLISNTVVTNNDDSTSEDALDVVTSDVYGKDFDWLVRYPDSIRSYYVSDDSSQSVSYQTKASTADVRKYYSDALAALGWTQSEDATDYVEYTKGDNNNPEIVTVWFTEYPKQNKLEYEIDYERALTQAELDDENATE